MNLALELHKTPRPYEVIFRMFNSHCSLVLQLTVFQPFFVVLNLPYSVVRGETLQTEILIFNYLNQDQNVKVTLDVQGEDWRGNSFRPPAQSTTVFVASNNLTKVVFPVSPTVVGEVEFKVVAQSASAGDAVQKSLTVKAEGVQQHFTAPVFVDLRNKSTFSVKVPIPLPQSGKVQGSERMVVSAIGKSEKRHRQLLWYNFSVSRYLNQWPIGCDKLMEKDENELGC